MAVRKDAPKLSEEELYAPDLNEGDLEVEHYLVPDSDDIQDPQVKAAWDEALLLLESGELDSEEEE